MSGEKEGTRPSYVRVYIPHTFPNPKLPLELLVCSRPELTMRLVSATAECQELVMTLFWIHHSSPASEQTLLITTNLTAVGDTAWTQMWITTSEFKKTKMAANL